MRKEKAEQELKKVREKLAKLKAKENELVEWLREKDKEEAAVIMQKYKVSPEELLEMLKEREAENSKLLLKAEERNLSETEQNLGFLETDRDKNPKENMES